MQQILEVKKYSKAITLKAVKVVEDIEIFREHITKQKLAVPILIGHGNLLTNLYFMKKRRIRKSPWEWFDDVQKKIATEPKLIVKRRGKKYKW